MKLQLTTLNRLSVSLGSEYLFKLTAREMTNEDVHSNYHFNQKCISLLELNYVSARGGEESAVNLVVP